MSDDKRKRKGLFAGLLELLGEEEGADEIWEHGGAPAEHEGDFGTGAVTVTADESFSTRPPEDDPYMSMDTRPRDDLPARSDPAPPATQLYDEPPPASRPAAIDDRLVRLTSPDVAERRNALAEIASGGLDGATAGAVADRLLYDPDLDVRTTALSTLETRPDLVSLELVRRALEDPADAVRAGAVRMAAVHGAEAIGDLARLAGARPWPAAQHAALGTLATLIGEHGITDAQLDTIATTIGQLDPAPTSTEQVSFSAVAHAIGRERLVAALGWSGPQRLGAARLLIEDGSGVALHAVADLLDDPDDDVRVAAALARSVLAGPAHSESSVATAAPRTERSPHQPQVQQQPSSQPAQPPASAPPGAPAEPATPPRPQAPVGPGQPLDPALGAELVAGLARTLTDPDESVRERAASALGKASRPAVERWVRSSLRQGPENDALAAAQVAQALGLREVAGDILERAAGMSGGARTGFVGALANLGVDASTLSELARGVESSRRHEAIRLVWQVAGPTAIPYLKPLLEDSSGPIRMVALEVIGASGDPEAPQLAHRILEADSSPSVRATAVKVLGRAELEDRLLGLSAAMHDPDPDVRATAVEVLLEGASRRASHLLLRAIEDPDDRVRDTALRHLAALPPEDTSVIWAALRQAPDRQREELLTALDQQGPERLAELAALNRGSPNAQERALAVELAGRAATPECVRHTIGALQDPAPEVRRTAAAALSWLRSPEAIPALATALKDPNPKVRIEVVHALGVVDDDEVVPVLIGALKDPEVRVRDQASSVLVRWSSPAVARRLVDALAAPDLSQAARDLLARMGQTAVEPLVEALLREDQDVVRGVGQLLQEIVGPDRFLDALTSLDPVDRLRAVEALGAIGGPRAVDGLVRALSDPDERIRVRALQQIGHIGDHRAYEAVRRAFASDPVLEVVEAAEDVLRRLEPSDEGPNV